MDLVLDANILFSALIKDGFTSELLFDQELKLYMPEFILEEFWKYENLILKKTKRSRQSYVEILHSLQEIITTIPKEELASYINKAKNISPDPKDVMYFALALKLKCGIWSNDKRLKNQDSVTIYFTEEVKDLI